MLYVFYALVEGLAAGTWYSEVEAQHTSCYLLMGGFTTNHPMRPPESSHVLTCEYTASLDAVYSQQVTPCKEHVEAYGRMYG